jgi:HK97 gp10 family phage protein
MADFEVQGIEELMRKIKQTDDKLNLKLQRKILKDAAKPIVKTSRQQAPDSDDYVKVRGYLITPGTLRKSIGVIVGKSKEFASVYVGARVKGAFGGYKGGWYAHFVHEGHKISNSKKSKGVSFGTTSKDPFQDRAYAMNKNQVTEDIKRSIVKVATKEFK